MSENFDVPLLPPSALSLGGEVIIVKLFLRYFLENKLKQVAKIICDFFLTLKANSQRFTKNGVAF
ncbi:MAG: hypothetical protein LBQ03_02260 [Puniceicoccales bacterium]|nr:hypothetical protein [Puniceicoccales bacterium]